LVIRQHKGDKAHPKNGSGAIQLVQLRKPDTQHSSFRISVYRSQGRLRLKVVIYSRFWSNYGIYKLWTINTLFYLLCSKWIQVNEKPDRQCTYNLILQRVRTTIVAVEKQW